MKTSNRQFEGGSSGMHPERRQRLDAVPCDHLAAHPLSAKIYGKPKPSKELLDSIAEHGLLQPIIVNQYQDRQHVLAGNTRAAAWRMLWKQKRIKTKWIPCRIVHLLPLEAERLIIESNRQRVKTAGQKARETHELVRIVRAARQNVREALKRLAHDTKQSGSVIAQQVLADLDMDQTSVSAAYREVVPQKRTLNNSPLGHRVKALETVARKLPNDLRDPTNKEFRAAAVERIGAAVDTLRSELLTSTSGRARIVRHE